MSSERIIRDELHALKWIRLWHPLRRSAKTDNILRILYACSSAAFPFTVDHLQPYNIDSESMPKVVEVKGKWKISWGGASWEHVAFSFSDFSSLLFFSFPLQI